MLVRYGLDKVVEHLISLSNDQAYNWFIVLLRINKSYDIKPVDWETLIEIYFDKIDILDTEIQRFRQQKNSGNNQIDANPSSSIPTLDQTINNALISLTIEDMQLHPILRNFRNEDAYREEMILEKDNPATRNRYIAHLKNLKSYYEKRRIEMEALQEFSYQSQELTSKVLNELHSALPHTKQSKVKQKTRGPGKTKPSYELTNELIEECLTDEYYYNKNDRPVPYRIIDAVLTKLDKKFRHKDSPGFSEMLSESGVKYRVKKYLKEHNYI